MTMTMTTMTMMAMMNMTMMTMTTTMMFRLATMTMFRVVTMSFCQPTTTVRQMHCMWLLVGIISIRDWLFAWVRFIACGFWACPVVFLIGSLHGVEHHREFVCGSLRWWQPIVGGIHYYMECGKCLHHAPHATPRPL